MDGLTSIAVNKNRKGFTPKVNNKHRPKKSKIDHDSTSNLNEPSKEGKSKISTSFIKHIITSSSTIPKANFPANTIETINNNSNRSDDNKEDNKKFIPNSKVKSNKNKTIQKSISVIINTPNNNTTNIPTQGIINNDIVNKSEMTKVTNDQNKTNATNNHNHGHNNDNILISESIDLSQNNNYHTSVFSHAKALSSLLYPSRSSPLSLKTTSKNNPVAGKEKFNSSYIHHTLEHRNDNKISNNRDMEDKSITDDDDHKNSLDNDISAPFLKRRLSQYIMDITHDEPPSKDKVLSNNINQSDIKDVNEDEDSEDEEEILHIDENILQECSNAPQVQIVDGKIVLDQSSLYIVQEAPKKRKYEYVEEDERSKAVNTFSHKKKPKVKGKRWTKEEIDLFYQGLKQFGTDFGMIANTIPARARVEVKNFFNRQEKMNASKITDAIFCRSSSS